MNNSNNISIENAQIMFRNFRGEETKFNPAGKRNFCVRLDKDISEVLKEDGWNVKYLKPREDGDEPTPYLQVSVNFDVMPPNVFMITKHNKTKLNGETIGALDWAEIVNVDLIIRPYHWEAQGKTGIKAYVKNMYVTIEEDEFADKYSDIPDGSLMNYGD